MASFAAGLSSGFPPGGSLSRSALALSCGARTAIAAMASSVVVLLVLLGGTALLAPLPRATLAALVIAAVIPLIRVKPLLQAWRIHAHDGMAGTLALVMTLALAPQMIHGFLIGVAVSIGLFLWRLTRPRVVDCGRHVDGTWRDRKRHGLEPVPGIAVLRPDARICFVGATAIEDAVYQAIVERPDLRVIVLSCDGVNELDATGCESLRAIASRLGESGITLAFAGLKGPVEEVARRAQLSGIHHSNLVFRTVDEAVATLSPKQVR